MIFGTEISNSGFVICWLILICFEGNYKYFERKCILNLLQYNKPTHAIESPLLHLCSLTRTVLSIRHLKMSGSQCWPSGILCKYKGPAKKTLKCYRLCWPEKGHGSDSFWAWSRTLVDLCGLLRWVRMQAGRHIGSGLISV